MREKFLPRYGNEIRLVSAVRLLAGSKKFKNLISEDIYFLDSATEAIAFFIENLNSDPKTVVGVPLYTCSSVLEAIRTTNKPIKLLDIVLDETGYHIDLEQIRNVEVMVFIHYFGVYFNDIAIIRDMYPNLIIVEDCSHVLFKNHVKSTFTAASVFSFNLHKPISCGAGGCLVVKNDTKKSNIIKSYFKLPVISFKADIKRFMMIMIKNYAHTQIFQNIIKNYLEKRRKLRASTSPHHNIQPHKLSFLSRCLLGNQYHAQVDCSSKSNYLRIDKRFRLKVNKAEAEKLLYFPVFLPNKDTRDAINNSLNELSIDSFILWENFLHNASYYSDKINSCPDTKTYSDRILYLPEALITNSDNSARFNKVIELLNKIK